MNDGGQDGDAPLSDAVEDAPVDPPAQFETQEDPRSGDDSHSAGHSGQGAVAPELSAGAFDDSNGADDPQTAPPDFGPAEAGRETASVDMTDVWRAGRWRPSVVPIAAHLQIGVHAVELPIDGYAVFARGTNGGRRRFSCPLGRS